MTATGPRIGGFSIAANLAGLILLLLMPFLASGDWTWGLGWLYTGSMILFMMLSRAIAIRLHPGFARERAAAGAMADTKGWDKWIVPLVALARAQRQARRQAPPAGPLPVDAPKQRPRRPAAPAGSYSARWTGDLIASALDGRRLLR